MELEELAASQPFEQREVFGEHADPRLRRDRIGPYVDAVDPDLPAIRAEQSGGHTECGGLAGTVGADDAEERAAGNVDVDLGDRDLRAECLGQPAHRQRGPGLARSPSRHLRQRNSAQHL